MHRNDHDAVTLQPITIYYGALLLIISILAMPLLDVYEKDIFIGVQFTVIAMITIMALVKENEMHSFSLTLCFFFFCYLFYYCAGIYQFTNDTFRWYLSPSMDDVIQGNFVVITGIISFIVGHFYHFRINRKDTLSQKAKFHINRLGLLLLIFILFLYICYMFSFLSVVDLFKRATFSASDADNQAIGLLITSFRNGIALICCMTFIYLYKTKKTTLYLIGMVASLVFALLAIPPTGVARFLSGSFYGAIFLYSFPAFRRGRKFLILMFFFILIVFPLLNNFRYMDGNLLSVFDILNGLSSNFQAADFDAYTMLLYTIQYVSDFGYSYGNQLIGTLTFFIPRSIWPTKPIGTGNMIVENMLIPINGNVSEPLFAEFYINFGYLGLVLFSIMTGCIFKTLDSLYWNHSSVGQYLKMIYPFLSLITIFICRGDMMSTVSFTFGTIVTSFLAYKLIYRRIN